MDFSYFDVKVHETKLDEDGNPDEYATFIYQYMTMYYNSAIAFALVEVNARTSSQIPAMFLLYSINALFNATIFGIFIDLTAVV